MCGSIFLPPRLCARCLMAVGKELGVCWESCDGGRSETGLPDANKITLSLTDINYKNIIFLFELLYAFC